MNRAEALRALASCDQLEAAIQSGDSYSIERAREMLKRFASGLETPVRSVISAFRITLYKASEGTIEDILGAIRQYKNLAEAIVENESMNENEEVDETEGDGP